MMRRVAAQFGQNVEASVHRAVALDAIAAEWSPELRLLAVVRSQDDKDLVARLQASGLANLGWIESSAIEVGDVVAPRVNKNEAVVLHREGDVHHSLLLTNRCNSYCLMCSQPPTRHDDSWLVMEALDVIHHIRNSPAVLGLSGGEPLLLGHALRTILDAIAYQHPSTRVEVLTNGRLLASRDVAQDLLENLAPNVTWLVPLYGHADFVHDFVVQSVGAFEEALAGLLTLQERRQPIQLRVVLVEPVLRVLPELCRFIARNLPFVREVALMACEPIGFALANRDQCEVDLHDWTEALESSSRVLRRHRIPYIFMNMPLCSLPRNLWADAHKSISDWKNVYADECQRCAVKDQCSGLFAWHERGWTPTKIRAIEGAVT